MIYLKKGQKLLDNPGMVVYDATGYYNDGDSIICATNIFPEEPVCRYEAKYIAYGGMVYSISDPDELLEQVMKIDPKSLFGKDSEQVAVDKMVSQIVPQETITAQQDTVEAGNATTTPESNIPESDTSTSTESVLPDSNTSTTTESVLPDTNTSTTTEAVLPDTNTSTTTQPLIPDNDTSTTTPEFTLPIDESTTTPDFISPPNESTTTPDFIPEIPSPSPEPTPEILIPSPEALPPVAPVEATPIPLAE
jgi:hypothetical protein